MIDLRGSFGTGLPFKKAVVFPCVLTRGFLMGSHPSNLSLSPLKNTHFLWFNSFVCFLCKKETLFRVIVGLLPTPYVMRSIFSFHESFYWRLVFLIGWHLNNTEKKEKNCLNGIAAVCRTKIHFSEKNTMNEDAWIADGTMVLWTDVVGV